MRYYVYQIQYLMPVEIINSGHSRHSKVKTCRPVNCQWRLCKDYEEKEGFFSLAG